MPALANLSIRSKLLWTYALVLCGTVALAVVAYLALGSASASVRQLGSESVPRQRLTAELQLIVQRYRTAEFGHISALVPEDQTPIEAAMKADDEELRAVVEHLKLIVGADDQARLTAFVKDWEAYGRYFRDEVQPISRDMMPNIAVRKVAGEHEKAFGTLLATIASVAKQAADEADVTATLAVSRQEATERTLAITTALVVIVGVLFALAVSNWIAAPLRRAAALADDVAAGDLSGDLGGDISAGSSDEVGRLLAALGRMSGNLRGMVAQLQLSADAIAAASGQIATSNQDLSMRTEQQAAQLQQAASTVSEISSSAAEGSDVARQVHLLAQDASGAAAAGESTVSKLVDTMAGIHDASCRIGEIVGLIDAIAFQTNLLALNAAVEAARAGDQGRGFAVVAEEVRMLARRSTDAARDIKRLIDDTASRVDAGSRCVDEARATMGDMGARVSRVVELIAEVSDASARQQGHLSAAAQSIEQIDGATQQNAALVEQTAAAADSLRQQADGLVGAVARFRLEPQAAR